MKVLLLGDASNYHFALSQGLARLGHDVTVASNGSRWMGTSRNIDLSRRPGRAGGAWLWLKLRTLLASDLRGYDAVNISNPVFLELKPHRVRAIFDGLKRDNGAVFLTMLGTDTPYVEMCLDPRSPLAYNEWRAYGKPTPYATAHGREMSDWLGPELAAHCRHVYENIDGAVSALYEYHLAALRALPSEKAAYGGIPIDIPPMPSSPTAAGGPVRIMCACHKGREAEKGVDLMLPALRQLERTHPGKVAVDLVQNVPLAQFRSMLAQCHIVVDQLYSYSPSTTPLMAMAMGKTVVSGGEPAYYDFIGEADNRPIVNPDPADPGALAALLSPLIERPERLNETRQANRAFAIKHNSADTVAARFADFWERRMP